MKSTLTNGRLETFIAFGKKGEMMKVSKDILDEMASELLTLRKEVQTNIGSIENFLTRVEIE